MMADDVEEDVRELNFVPYRPQFLLEHGLVEHAATRPVVIKMKMRQCPLHLTIQIRFVIEKKISNIELTSRWLYTENLVPSAQHRP